MKKFKFPKFSLCTNGLDVELAEHWFVCFWWNPKVWTIDFHVKSICCKLWLCVGPFEINRVWADDDEYPFD